MDMDPARLASVSLAGLLAPLFLIATAAPAAASCPASTMSVTPSNGEPGSTVIVSGQYWQAGCNDTGTTVVGETPSPPPPALPETVTISFSQDERTVLSTVTAASDYTFSQTVTIPITATNGPATFTGTSPVGGSATTDFIVVAPTAGPGPSGDSGTGGGGTATADELPVTGARDVLPEAAAGVGLALLGALLALSSRRRRPMTPAGAASFPS